jgi:LCP family protein required for cell wall assembly
MSRLMARAKTALGWILLALLTLLVIATVAVWIGLHNIAPRMSLGDLVDVIHPGASNDALSLKIEHDQRINLLLMARGGAGSDNPYFTDSMLVLSIQPRERQAVLVALPRFLLVPIPALTGGEVTGKLYTAFDIGTKQDNPALRSAWTTATGSGDLAAASVGEVTGLPIDGWIAVDVGGFRTIVDALGGIDVPVPVPLDDPLYPIDNGNRRAHIHFNAGSQRMSGERALEYARSRLSTSEADRSTRQEAVLLAILQRVRSLKAGLQLLPVLNALQGRLLTNLRPADARPLADLQATLPVSGIRRVTVGATNFVDDQAVAGGSEIALPRDPSFAALKHFLALALPDPRLVNERVPIIVSDGSNAYELPAGQTPAGIEVQLLSDLGWNAMLGPDRQSAPVARTQILTGANGSAAETAQWMAGFFGAVTTDAGPLSSVQVVLGSDFAARTFPAVSR